MKVMKKNNVGYSPFNCIALKDIKDKETGKGNFNSVIDCVTSMSDCVAKLKDYSGSAQDSSEASRINEHIKNLVTIQEDLLEIYKGKISQQIDETSGQNLGDPSIGNDPLQAKEPMNSEISANVPTIKVK